MNVDATTGLYYDNARWNNSSLGVFTSPDPLKSDPNAYRYVRDNPLVATDPTGNISAHALVWALPLGADSTSSDPVPTPPVKPKLNTYSKPYEYKYQLATYGQLHIQPFLKGGFQFSYGLYPPYVGQFQSNSLMLGVEFYYGVGRNSYSELGPLLSGYANPTPVMPSGALWWTNTGQAIDQAIQAGNHPPVYIDPRDIGPYDPGTNPCPPGKY